MTAAIANGPDEPALMGGCVLAAGLALAGEIRHAQCEAKAGGDCL